MWFRAMTIPVRAPGPTLWEFFKAIYRYGSNPLPMFSWFARRYGPIVRIGRGEGRVFFVSSPELIREVLVAQADGFVKDRGLDATRPLLGNGLLTSEGEFHLRQRRLAQPAFHRSRLPHYAGTMVECARRRVATWSDGQSLDFSKEMNALTLDVVARTLFGADVGDRFGVIAEALDYCMEQYTPPRIALLPLLQRLPLPSTFRFRRYSRQLKGTIEAIIAERRRSRESHDDLLSMLLVGDAMTDEQLRDECLTLFLAGHETTANALSWTFHLLSLHPEAALRIRAELGSEELTMDHLPKLHYTDHVIREAWRLFPPAWTLGRRALRATSLGGYPIPKDATVVMSQWVVHRRADLYPDPERFSPERWTPQFIAALPRFGFFPFGGGTRICVAEAFARAETLLLLGTLLRDWEFRGQPGHEVRPQTHITLRPKGGLPGTVHRP
jgi:cytochrome P450